MTTVPAAPGAATTRPSPDRPLQHIYLARAGIAVAWAGLFAATGSTLGVLAAVLLVVYPLIDVTATLLDLRAARRDRSGAPSAGLSATVAVSTLAAAALAVAAAAGDVPAVLRVFGTWAVVAGLVQLAVAVSRRRLGGQWAQVASGAISVLAGSSFIASASGATSMTQLSGYAVAGAVFFTVSALLLRRRARQAQTEVAR